MGASPSYYVYDPAHGSLDVVSPYSLTHSYQATGKWTHSYFTA
ncbi:hypothetical protein SAMN05443579_11597 [Variovorax sp. PDC80]|nr:hypothetical protein SAMN05443579_11597 [Variovorax sp. PDC80]